MANNNNRIRRAFQGLRDFLQFLTEDPQGRYIDEQIRRQQPRRAPDNRGAAERDALARAFRRISNEQELNELAARSQSLADQARAFLAPARDNVQDNAVAYENVENEPLPDNVDPGSMAEILQRTQSLARQMRRYNGRGRVGGGKGSSEAKRRMAYVRSFKGKH